MPSFPKPAFTYNFQLDAELQRLRQHKAHRGIPGKRDDRLLLATWNIANLGDQERQRDHHRLLAEMISWFDVVAVQEVKDDLSGLRAIESELPGEYDLLFSDKGGNDERSCFIYDGSKVKLLELVGEIAIAPSDHRHIKLPGVASAFTGFDRNPYLASFAWRNLTLVLITVHSFFGREGNTADEERRALETFAIGRWADLRRNSKYAFSKQILAMGDFNLPKVQPGDPIYDALRKRGLELPEHTSKVYSNLNNDKQYDQIAFLPGIKKMLTNAGIFDFDSAVLPDLWQQDVPGFKAYMRYYLSDHRPFWLELKEG